MARTIIPLNDTNMADYVRIHKAASHEKRIKILFMLNHSPVTWSKFMVELDIRNPKLLHDHISVLSSSGMITKNRDGAYCLTGLGSSFIAANLPLIKALNRRSRGSPA